MLEKRQLEIIKQQLATVSDDAGVSELDPQLKKLLQKHFTLYVGADVCRDSFVVEVKKASDQTLLKGQFDNHHTGFQQFLSRLQDLNPENIYRIQVATECTGPYHLSLVRFLLDHGIEVFVFSGQTAKHLAKAYLLEKKTDSLDAGILAKLLIDGKFPTSQTEQDNPFLEIRSFSRRASRYAEQIAEAKTKLKDELAQASPGMLSVFPRSAIFNKAPMELLSLYPLPQDRLVAGVEKISNVLMSQSGKKYGQTEAEKLLAFDAQNQGNPQLLDYFRQSIRDYISEIHYFETKREQYLEKLQEKTKDVEPAQNLLSLKGCGPILMPMVLGEVGNIKRFPSSDKFVGYAGLAPIEHESGPYKGEKHLKKGGSPRLSYACYLIGNCARRYDPRLKNLYLRIKERHLRAGKPKGIAHIIANCAVAREIAVLIYRILSENRPYFKDSTDYKAYRAEKKSQAQQNMQRR